MKNIALFVGFLDNEFSMDVMEGARIAAKELGVNLFIIPVRLLIENYSEAELNVYTYQYNTMFSYVEKGNFDGVIVETGVVCNGMSDEDVKELFDSFGVPTVSIARKIEGYPNIRFNCNGLREEIEHLIHHHGCKRIGFIGGPKNNGEAIERIELYKRTLLDNGIEFDKKLCGMGNFSEFCEDEVIRVVEQNEGNIDALCFANDRMVIGGYWALQKLNLVPGKDIMITGFDDAPSASAMNPPLTTVHSNIPMLGRNAVKQCVALIDGRASNDIFIDTSTVIRSSCGCPSRAKIISDKISQVGALEQITAEALCSDIRSFLFETLNLNDTLKIRINEVVDSFYGLLTDISTPHFDSKAYINEIYGALSKIDFETVSYGELSFALTLVRKKACAIAYDKQQADDFFYDLLDVISDGEFNRVYDLKQNYRDMSQITSAIVYDVLANINNEAASYQFIITNVRRHNTDSSFLFIHDLPVVCQNIRKWKRPRKERLVCYQDGDKDVIPTHEMQEYDSANLFRCPLLTEEPHVFVANPLFYNEEHYGILFVEKEQFDHAYFEWVVFKQICYALKMKHLMEEQMSIHAQLSKNMELIESYNAMLEKKSVSDELTGIYNRRGFIERVTEQLNDPANLGKRAVIVYADMNYLKLVNDRFGHDEGDFAIRGVASILKSCFRSSDVVARFGGDEFAAFGFIRGKNFENILRSRMKESTDEFNDTSGKPYLVTASMGVYEFVCDECTNLTECMNKADSELYEDKKNKPKTIMK
ncbi:MAG: GGDEF domain-containing protein [Ruminococcaceae bacterium]|nr:GGDEF domain-containing protein [Oscillospiraceae bacterium]